MPIKVMSEVETILKKNDVAPFMGVLVPEDQYREYYKAIEYNKYLLEKVNSNVLYAPTLGHEYSGPLLLGLGLIVGFGVGSVLFHTH